MCYSKRRREPRMSACPHDRRPTPLSHNDRITVPVPLSAAPAQQELFRFPEFADLVAPPLIPQKFVIALSRYALQKEDTIWDLNDSSSKYLFDSDWDCD